MAGKEAPILAVLADAAAEVKADAAAFSKTNTTQDDKGKTVVPKPPKTWVEASISQALVARTAAIQAALVATVEDML